MKGPSSVERDQAPGFLMGLTAIAAVLMVGFTLMLAQGKHLEVNGPLSADEPLEQTLEELEAENAEEIQRLGEEKAPLLPDGETR